MNRDALFWIAAGVGAYLLARHMRKSGSIGGFGAYRPPCRSDASCDAFRRLAKSYRAKGDRIKDAGYAELANKFYALADQATKRTSGCCKPGESPEERQKEWAEKLEKYRMTPEELEKAKDQIDINYEKVRQLYQKMADEGKSYHGMTPAQLRKWIADIPKKIAEKVKELERYPYKPIPITMSARKWDASTATVSAASGGPALDAASLDFSIDAKTNYQNKPIAAPAVVTNPEYYRSAWARENPGEPFPGIAPGGIGVRSPASPSPSLSPTPSPAPRPVPTPKITPGMRATTF